jgi:hypothetical protein
MTIISPLNSTFTSTENILPYICMFADLHNIGHNKIKIRDFNKGRHPVICRRFKRVKSAVRLLETKIFFHQIKEIYNIYSLFHLKDF